MSTDEHREHTAYTSRGRERRMDTAHTSMPAVVHVSQMTDATLLVQLAGNWQLRTGVPELTEIQQQLDDAPRVRQLPFEILNMPAWDTGLLTFLLQLLDYCQHHQIVVDQSGLPEGVRRLLALATAVPEREGARRACPGSKGGGGGPDAEG